MAILRSFRILFRNSNSRSFVKPCASTTPLSSQSHPLSSIFSSTCSPTSSNPFLLTSSHSRFLSPLSRWIPFSGPLFLSSPPCLLLQSATPLYLQGDIEFKQVEPLNPKFLRKRTFPDVVKWIDNKELRNGGDISGEPSEKFFNLPNLISISRLVSGPFIGWMIINDWYLSAFLGLALSGATDWLDGYVARRMGINSVVGSYLDPLADKVLIGCVALAMVKKDLLHSWLVGLVVLRDVGLISGAVYQRAYSLDWKWKNWSEFTNLNENRPQRVEPLYLSKINTVFQLVLVAAALLQPELGTDDTQVYITYMSWLVASTTVASTLAYGVKYIKNGSRLPSTGKLSRSKSH